MTDKPKNGEDAKHPRETPCYVTDLFEEYDGTNKACVTDGHGKVLRQLEKPTIRKDGKTWHGYGDILTYCTKKEAIRAARAMGVVLDNVEQIHGPLGFMPWVIKYDFRYPYYHACWEV